MLLICHGESIATQMAQIARRMVKGNYALDVIDFPSQMQLNDVLELACLKVCELNQGAGVLIACDMEPLTSIAGYVHRQTRIATRGVSGITLSSFVRIVEQSVSPFNDLDRMCRQPSAQTKEHSEPQMSEHTLIDQIKERIIAKTVSFIDVDKAVRVLTACLAHTLRELQMDDSEVLTIKYLCHCTNLLERVIQNEVWEYPKAAVFMKRHHDVLHAVEHGMAYAEDAFGVKIPLSELVYVTQIFLPQE